jgi:hypothetical protein
MSFRQDGINLVQVIIGVLVTGLSLATNQIGNSGGTEPNTPNLCPASDHYMSVAIGVLGAVVAATTAIARVLQWGYKERRSSQLAASCEYVVIGIYELFNTDNGPGVDSNNKKTLNHLQTLYQLCVYNGANGLRDLLHAKEDIPLPRSGVNITPELYERYLVLMGVPLSGVRPNISKRDLFHRDR